MSEVYLLIGGNLGDRFQNLMIAKQKIENECGRILKSSAVYETAAWGVISQPDFLNQVLMIQTNLSPHRLMDTLLGIERKMWRIRNEKFGARTIDIDILFYDQLIIEEEDLTIPHPRFSQRRFVLIPLVEIASELIDPLSQKNMLMLLHECPDLLTVKEFSPNVHKNEQ